MFIFQFFKYFLLFIQNTPFIMSFKKNEKLIQIIREELNKINFSEVDSSVNEDYGDGYKLNIGSLGSDDFAVIPSPQSAHIDESVIEEAKKEVIEAKNLAEEFKRMKELIDFRSPLLNNGKPL